LVAHQDLEKKIKETKHAMSMLSLTRHGAQSELTDLVRSRTELGCIVTDLQTAASRTGGARDALQADLLEVEEEIAEKETELADLLPRWDNAKLAEAEERRATEEARAKVDSLYAKRGRMEKFRNRQERDAWLRTEIASLESFRSMQGSAAEEVKAALEQAKGECTGVEQMVDAARRKAEDGRQRAREIAEEIAALREEIAEKSERRKELWREDTRLKSLVQRAEEEMRSAERALAGMMDKDTGMGLRAVDRISERPGFEGVYGPLYKLFEITDDKFNIAVELTAGNRRVLYERECDCTNEPDQSIPCRCGRRSNGF
jgi:structural maintenance of chromosome 3 (chondroitin sulfate proteoglycan 6)